MNLEEFRRKQWGMERMLFGVSPPERRYLDKVFTGRSEELETTRISLYDAPRRVLISGLFGIGKTVFTSWKKPPGDDSPRLMSPNCKVVGKPSMTTYGAAFGQTCAIFWRLCNKILRVLCPLMCPMKFLYGSMLIHILS
jgi:hypothetical protein